MFKKTKWIFIGLLVIAFLSILAIDVYCGIVGVFEIYDVDMSQETTPLDFQSSLAAYIKKVEDRIYVLDITDDENMRQFLLKNGKIRILFNGEEYIKEFMNEGDIDSSKAFFSMSSEVAQYNLVANVLTCRGKKIADNVFDYYVSDDGSLYYIVADDGYTYVELSGNHRIHLSLDGQYRDMKIGKDLVCIAEQKGSKKKIHIFDRERGTKLHEIEDGETPLIINHKVAYITTNGIAVYDIDQKTEKVCTIDEMFEIQTFDPEYVYYLTKQNDVGRVKLQDMSCELILKSNMNDPIIKLYLKIITMLST